ncbi:MAG TPA: RNA-binding domain-containing protein [Dysgonamonadaceae bacterium]|nr:RNA-binding domain-containing protein [Dysgonamonadaceae bacterium]
MNRKENNYSRHRKYRLIEQFDTFSKVLDLESDTDHICFKIESHEIGDEFYLYLIPSDEDITEKLIFRYSILNKYKEGETYTFDIIEERYELMFISNCKNLNLPIPSKFKDGSNQAKIDLEVEQLDLNRNKVLFKRKSTEGYTISEDFSEFEEGIDYEFELKKTYLNKLDNLIMIVGYKDRNYRIYPPSYFSHVAFKSPVYANIFANEDGSDPYLRLALKYISNTFYTEGKRYLFTIKEQVYNHESDVYYWLMEDENGKRNRYYPENDLTFDNEIAKLREGDTIELYVQWISDSGQVTLIYDVKNWKDKNYLVEDVFEAIGYSNKEDKYFFNYSNMFAINDGEFDDSECSFLEQYNEGNNLWVFSYLSFLDVEMFNELEEGRYDEAKTLIDIYLRIEKWMLEESDYLTNFSQWKRDGIIIKAEHKIVKLKASLSVIDMFLEGKDQEYIESLNTTLLRTRYLNSSKKEELKQFLAISKYFRGEADFEELSKTIFLLLECNLISDKDRWMFIFSITSFITRIKDRVREKYSDDNIVDKKNKEIKQLITNYYLLVFIYVKDENFFYASIASVNLLRNLSLYYNKVEYLDLAINLIIHNGYFEPNIFMHKNIFELDCSDLRKISVYDKEKEYTFHGAGNVLSLNDAFSIIPKNLYNNSQSCKLKTLAKLGKFNLYVKSHYNLNGIDEADEIYVLIDNVIQAIKHNAVNSENDKNLISYKELDVSLDEVYEGKITRIHPSGDYCYLTCVIDGFVIDSLLHINTFNKNRMAGYINEYLRVGDVVRFKVIGVDDNKILISSSNFIDGYAEVVLSEDAVHYGRVVQRNDRYSRVLTESGLTVITKGYSYELGDTVRLKIDKYKFKSHLYISKEHSFSNKVILEDNAEIFRKYLIANGMLAQIAEQDKLSSLVSSTMRSFGHIKAFDNSKELKTLSLILIHIMEHRLNYLAEPKEIAINYFFIITLSGVMQNSKSFQFGNKLNNLARIVNLEHSKDVELLDSVFDIEFVKDREELQKIEEVNNTIKMLDYIDSDLIDLPVCFDASSPQYKLKKLIEAANLIKSYQLGSKLTNAIKKLVVHELYSTLQVSHNSIKELQSILSDEDDVKQTEKPKRVVTNLGAESKYKEFKSSLFYAASQEPQSDVIMRTVCGFLNAYEGTGYLYIGVDDSGEIKGLKEDLTYNKNIHNLDKYQNHLQSLIAEAFPKEINTLLDYRFHKSGYLNYLEIIIPAHDKPVTYKDEFYQRQGVQTRILKGKDITDFIIRKTTNPTITPKLRPQVDASVYANDEIDDVEQSADNVVGDIENERVEESALKNNDSYKYLKQQGDIQPAEYDMEDDSLLGYLYVLKNNMYMLSATQIKEYEVEVPITEKYKFGHLLFCYDNACVNKVDVRSLISKSFNTIYLNALSDQGNLMGIIKSLSNEMIGVETIRNDKRYVKLYSVDKLPEHKIVGLKGNCIVQESFDKVEAYYHNERLPEVLDVFVRNTKKGFGEAVKEYEDEYELLKKHSKQIEYSYGLTRKDYVVSNSLPNADKGDALLEKKLKMFKAQNR